MSEAEHPLLCEGTRRQRGDLALLLLVHYKDQPARSETCRELSLSYEAISWVHLAFRGIMKIFLIWRHLVVKGGHALKPLHCLTNLRYRLGAMFSKTL